MFRLLIIVALCLSLVYLGRGMLASFKPLALPPPVAPAATGKKASVKGFRLADFYPQPPAVLPDLREGYLFNEARQLAAADEDTEETTPEPEEPSVAVDMETLEYVGSIIVGAVKKGMVAFVEKTPASRKPLRPQRRAPAATRRFPPQTAAKKTGGKGRAKKKYATLKEKDEFYGYTVALVAPDRMVFTKGEESIEKLLYDPAKERLVPPAIVRPSARPAAGARAAAPAAGNKRQARSAPSAPRKPPVVTTPRRLPTAPHTRPGQPPVVNRRLPPVIQRRQAPTPQKR